MDNRLQHVGEQTRYTLDIHDSPVRPDVLRFHGRECLSAPFRWHIVFTTAEANIPPEQVLMKYASLRMRGGKTVHGIVTKLEQLSTSADQTHYRVTLSARLALLSHSRRSAVYQHQSVIEVVEQVLRSHGLEGADFEFRLTRTYPPRELITQWRETDLEFVQRLLSEVGIFWRTEMDDARELDVTIFADSQLHYHFDVRLPYREPAGLFDSEEESVWGVRTWHKVVTGSVSTRDYHYRTATTSLDATVSVRHESVTTGGHYRYATPHHIAGDDSDPEPETESGAFYARLHHERELNNATRIHLHSNASGLAPGQVLEPQGEGVTRALKEGVIITLTTFRASRDASLRVSVWGMPYSERYCFRPSDIPRPSIRGTLSARIESREKGDMYAHLDEHGRYRVKLDFDLEDTEHGYGYLWLRMATPHAGDTLGWHAPLIDGTEVAIAYSNGDIDLPYIAYALHDSAHPNPVNRDNHTRNVLRTPANNKLRMEDKRGEEHIKLATEYGKTQLNQGHLVDAQGKQRGSGTELRTDERGVIRAGKGLFVSADAQLKAAGPVLDMDAALKEIAQLTQQLQQLDMAAEQAQALSADIDNQIRMVEQRLTPLDGAMHFSAPEGMAFTSGEHLQLAAMKNVAINAGGDISVGVMGNMTAQVGEKLGMFARTGPLSLKSGEGSIVMQAQNGEMKLFAQKKLTVASEGDISFVGKKRITLIGGGSYLTLEAGKVEYGTTGTYLRRTGRTMVAGVAPQPLNMPSLADPIHEAVDGLPAATVPPLKAAAPLPLPTQIYTTQHIMDDYHAPDMLYKDIPEEALRNVYGLTDISTRCNPFTMADRQKSAAILFDEFRELSDMVSFYGPYQGLMRQLIDHMQGNSGATFRHPLLDRAMSERIDMTTETMTLEKIKEALVEYIDWGSGCYPLHRKNELTKAVRDTVLPQFNSWADRINGLGITVHDTWATHITLQSLTVSGNRFTAQVHFRIQDHFGLDDADVQSPVYRQFRMFRIWFLLQRWVEYGYRPFITEMNVTKTIEGSR